MALILRILSVIFGIFLFVVTLTASSWKPLYGGLGCFFIALAFVGDGFLTWIARIVSMLIGVLALAIAYRFPDQALPFIAGGSFFFLMAFLSYMNMGKIDGPYVYFAMAVMSFFFCLLSLYDGAFKLRTINVARNTDPLTFWTLVTFAFVLGFWVLMIGVRKLRKKSLIGLSGS